MMAGFALPSRAAAPVTVSGVVRNSAGVPQIGAMVQLLAPDFSILTAGYTDDKGRFAFAGLVPGNYGVKAMGESFLPSLRENLHVHRSTVVNLTLNTLFEVVQWLPAQPRSAAAHTDDWEWTLRSAANRPLLRWLEDGPLVVVSDGPASKPRLMARLMATGTAGAFGESGERISTSLKSTPAGSRELLAQVDFSPNTNAGMNSMLGFSQDLGFAGSVQSLAGISIQPDIETGSGSGLEELTARGEEDFALGDEFDVEAGGEAVLARLMHDSPNTITAMLPFVSVGWHDGNETVRYSMTTALATESANSFGAGLASPRMGLRNGVLTLESGLHNELGWERSTDTSDMSVAFYADNLHNPVLEATTQGALPADLAGVLFDPQSGMTRAAANDFSSQGVTVSYQHKLPGNAQVEARFATGQALAAAPNLVQPVSVLQAVSLVRPRMVQSYTISLSGKLSGSGTKWRASYRWQPEDTLTQVAQYAANGDPAYLGLHLRQDFGAHSEGTGNVAALLDVRNLLAQGYRPVVMRDGSIVILSQQARTVTAGLAFTF